MSQQLLTNILQSIGSSPTDKGLGAAGGIILLAIVIQGIIKAFKGQESTVRTILGIIKEVIVSDRAFPLCKLIELLATLLGIMFVMAYLLSVASAGAFNLKDLSILVFSLLIAIASSLALLWWGRSMDK
jgi:hypothetical protein